MIPRTGWCLTYGALYMLVVIIMMIIIDYVPRNKGVNMKRNTTITARSEHIGAYYGGKILRRWTRLLGI